MLSNYRMNFMKMTPDSRFTTARKTDIQTGERFYELNGDMYALAFFAFYIDDEEREENFILESLEKQKSNEQPVDLPKRYSHFAEADHLRMTVSQF